MQNMHTESTSKTRRVVEVAMCRQGQGIGLRGVMEDGHANKIPVTVERGGGRIWSQKA